MSAQEARERSTSFTAAQVRATLDGRMTQTRRVVKPQPTLEGGLWMMPKPFGAGWSDNVRSVPALPGHSLATRSPYGAPGDRLWVRETWQAWSQTSIEYDEWEPWDAERRGGLTFTEYREDYGDPHSIEYRATSESMGPWTRSIHMPRWASRLTLEITDVRVERLQEISEADAVAEGATRRDAGWSMDWSRVGLLSRYAGGVHLRRMKYPLAERDIALGTARTAFASIWDSQYAPRAPRHIRRRAARGKPIDRYVARHAAREALAWAANPWVWVITFKPLEVAR